jgi:4-amino-4-deoxy-L-arabinose transferase-like glycosyltransferase
MEINLDLPLQLRRRLDKWLLILLLFLGFYAVFLTINLSYMSMQWDEVNHFTGGLLLVRGQFLEYFLTSSFYPPIFNLVTAIYFAVAGASVLIARFVSVTFSLLSVVVVYTFARRMYGSKTGIVSAVLFGVMPGVVWLSRMAMIETMLIFVFCLCMFFFFNWLKTNRERDRILSIAALAVGIVVKYQMLVVAPLVMLAAMFFWKRDYLKTQFDRFLKFKFLILAAIGIAIGLFVVYELFISGLMGTLLYSIQVGTAERSLYSVRFPIPFFYFIEMVWPYSNMHPISLLLYIFGILGLGLWAFRRKREDIFLLLWFFAIYLVFTLIPNREWRYVTLLFPVLAISAATFIVKAFEKTQKTWRDSNTHLNKHWLAKVAALFLIGLTTVGVFYSCRDAYSWVARDQLQVPIEQATTYAGQNLNRNQSIVVAFPLNFLNEYMVWFYLNAKNSRPNEVWQYPELAVDSYMPKLNTTEFTLMCQQKNVKYVFLYENGGGVTYFNSSLTSSDVYDMLNNTGRFAPDNTFGTAPNRIFVLSFR